MRTFRALASYLRNFLLGVAALSWPAFAQTTAAGQWTWVAGSSTVPAEFDGQPGVYGTMGTPAPGNTPGARESALSWTDSSGHLWMFGGLSSDTSGQLSYYNDLWEFDPATGEWAWMGGSSTVGGNCPVEATLPYCGRPGVYGTVGTPAASNTPGGRYSSQSWADANGDLWLYGGLGFDAAGNWGALSDLWRFSPSANQWTWMGGSSTVPLNANCDSCILGQLPVPGTLGTPAPGNTPGGLWLGTSWTDNSGNFWLFGGWGYGPDGYAGIPNDYWQFNPSTVEWAWMGGSSDFGVDAAPTGTYGVLGTPAAGNVPGARWQGANWTDASGNLWLFGGQGYDLTDTEAVLDDLWEFNPSTNEWAWIGGSSTVNCSDPTVYCHQNGVYGTLGVPAAGNIPGSRYALYSWVDLAGNLWLFGGEGFDANSNWNYLNDLWEYSPAKNEWAWVGGSGAETSGVYGALGTPAAGNLPGARQGGVSWTDTHGNFWLWGGSGYDASGTYGYLNDLWVYKPSTTAFGTPAATPVFSPAAGAYSSPQQVTIADATTGAAIHYTTDGVTTPTASSTLYTGAIPVSANETIQAIAVATSYLSSSVASAAYTILPPPGFTLSGTAVSVAPGATTGNASTITLTPVSGFTGSVTLTAALTTSPSGAVEPPTFSFGSTSPVGITGTAAGTATLTISTMASSSPGCANTSKETPHRFPWSGAGGAALAGLLLIATPKRSHKWRSMLSLALLLLALAGGAVACGGGKGGVACPTVISPGTTAGTYVITVTGTSGAMTQIGTVTLTVQ